MYCTTEDNCIGSGIEACFYKLDEKRGFKMYYDDEDASQARKVQLDLSEHNCAPRVLSEVGRIRIDGKLSGWGYVTEIAELIEHDDAWDYDVLNLNKKIGNLISKIDSLGYNFFDCHLENIGYIKRGSRKILVCIDTGSM